MDHQSVQQLIMFWNVDVMGEGMQGVVCPGCAMPALDFAVKLVENAQVSGVQARLISTSTLQMCSVFVGR